jgi:nucleoside-diphosphate-sugar epimerase
MAHSYSHLYGMPYTDLRFFTVYGPWYRPDMALFVFADAIVRGDPVKAVQRRADASRLHHRFASWYRSYCDA